MYAVSGMSVDPVRTSCTRTIMWRRRSAGALGDAPALRRRHIIVRVQLVRTGSTDIPETAYILLRHRGLQSPQNHLGELLARQRVIRAKTTIPVSGYHPCPG